MPAIVFSDISKKYEIGLRLGSLRDNIPMILKRLVGKKPRREYILALRDVSFEVDRGEALGIIGPNGAGKTTILKLLSNVTKATAGTIETEGRVSALIELGAGFHPDLTGRENIYLNGSILGLKRREIEERFDEIVAFSELEKFIDTPVKYYSSGMYVRLGFSVAAHINPDILLIDEVLAVGDMSFKRKCLKRMDELRGNDTTIVFVSHDLRSVETVCKRAIFLLNGEVISEGDVRDVITAYQKYDMERVKSIRDKADTSKIPEEVFISGVHFIGRDGNECGMFYSGEKITVRVDYIAPKKIESPIFVIRVERTDGLVCFIVRTRHSGIVMNDIKGKGYFEAEFGELSLNAGIYNMQVAVKDSRDILVYGSSYKSFKVLIREVDFGANAGIYFPEVKWRQS